MAHFLAELENYYTKIYIKKFYDIDMFDVIYENLIDFLFRFQKELVRGRSGNC